MQTLEKPQTSLFAWKTPQRRKQKTLENTNVYLLVYSLYYFTPNSLSILSNGAIKNGGIVQMHTHTKKFVYPNVSCIYPAIIPGIIIPSAIKPVQIA